MHAVTFVALALSALVSALPASSKRDCTKPDQFNIRQFGIFTPAEGNPHPQNLAFEVGTTECSSNITSNPATPIACDDSDFAWKWDGKNTLTLGKAYTPCNSSTPALAVGSLFISLDCIPVTVPFGPGTLCQDPVGNVGEEFTRNSW